MNKIYILSGKQISVQKPLSEEWMENADALESGFVRAQDPDFKQFISAGDARRMGKLLKRALATSLSVLGDTGVENPDAIITGTGFGSVENTELFLDAMVREGEQMLKPTQFMQSTHNTASSLIGIHTHSHGYNSTYSQKGMSFDSALYDAWLQFSLGKIGTALVGGHDEMTPVFSEFMRKAGHVKEGETCSEASVSILLADREPVPAWCTVDCVKLLDNQGPDMLADTVRSILGDTAVDAVMTGMSGNAVNDGQYAFIGDVLPGVPLLRYKHMFGVNFSSSAVGIYAAAVCINKKQVPASIAVDGRSHELKNGILVVNADGNRHYSFVLLRPLCGRH